MSCHLLACSTLAPASSMRIMNSASLERRYRDQSKIYNRCTNLPGLVHLSSKLCTVSEFSMIIFQARCEYRNFQAKVEFPSARETPELRDCPLFFSVPSNVSAGPFLRVNDRRGCGRVPLGRDWIAAGMSFGYSDNFKSSSMVKVDSEFI